MTLFKATNTAAHPRKKAPTSHQYYSTGIKGRLATTPVVEAIFMPSGKINSYGFMCGETLRLNIYHDDPRFEECAAIIERVVTEGLILRVKHSKDDRGLATLHLDPKRKGEWVNKGSYHTLKQDS